MSRGELTVIAAWFMPHPLFAKKMYMTMVMANDARYMDMALPTSMPVQTRDSVVSIFS